MFILQRLKEPSTLAGLSALGLLAGIPPGTMDAVYQVGVAVLGAAAIFMPESK